MRRTLPSIALLLACACAQAQAPQPAGRDHQRAAARQRTGGTLSVGQAPGLPARR